MKRMMKNTMKKVLCFTLLAILFIANTTTVSTMAATLNSRLPIYCYTLNGKVNTYSSVGGNRTGSIYTSDKCTILAVYDSGWIKVKYPVSWGSRTAYAKTSDFFCNSQMNVETAKLGKQMTVYRRSDASQSFGTVYASDEVVIIGNNGTNTQIIYNVSGGYKLGWVKGVYTNKVNSGFSIMNTTNLITTTTTTTKEKLTLVTNFPSGYYQIGASKNPAFVFDIFCWHTTNGANLLLYQDLNTINQVFYIKNLGNGIYTIMAAHSGKLLDVQFASRESGANVIQQEDNGGDNQKWYLYVTDDGFYSFKSKLSGMFLDISGGEVKNDSNIQVYHGNHTHAQKFVLDPVTLNGDTCVSRKTTNNNTTSWDSLVGTTVANIGSTYYTTENLSYNGGYKGQCTWYAYGRFAETTGIFLNSAPDAKKWLSDNSSDNRVKVLYGAGNIQEKSIAVRTTGTWGHVLFVEEVVYENGSPKWVYFTECNADGNGYYNSGKDCVVQKLSYSDFVSKKNPAGYIIAR